MGYYQSFWIFYGLEVDITYSEYMNLPDEARVAERGIELVSTGNESIGFRVWLMRQDTHYSLSEGAYDMSPALTYNQYTSQYLLGKEKLSVSLIDRSVELKLPTKGVCGTVIGGWGC